MKLVGVIPARYGSSRFPGKPIALLANKPLIAHVYEKAIRFSRFESVYVAVDDERIASVCESHGIPFVMTRDDHVDCLDRVAEVAESVDADRYIVIQGDEPFFDVNTLDVTLTPEILGFVAPIKSVAELYNTNIIKVAVATDSRALYFSRNIIPFDNPKTRRSAQPARYFKQLGLYSMSRQALSDYARLGMSPLEGLEGVGLLRFLDHGFDVHVAIADTEMFGVDTKEDLAQAEARLCQKSKLE